MITGTVTDAATHQPVSDVVVTATSPQLQGEQIVVTDTTGTYRIPQLPQGVYSIRFEKEAYKPYVRGEITVRPDTTVRVNVEMLPETAGHEEIVVVGRPPTVDVGSSSTGVTVGSDFVKNLAVARPGGVGGSARSFESLALTAPQATGDLYGVSLSGSTAPENSYQIDGLSVNNPGYGVNGAPLGIEFVDEVNIVTGGYLPEYGRSTGGAITALTKSGGNEFHGSVYANLTPGLLASPFTPISTLGSAISRQAQGWNIGDFGANLGGYIMKDRLWFFVGIQPSFSRYRIERDIGHLQACTAVGPGCSAVGAANTTLPAINFADATSYIFADDRMLQYLGKLTFLISQDHRLSLTVSGTPDQSGSKTSYPFYNGTNGAGPNVPYGGVTGQFGALGWISQNSSSDVTLHLASSFMDKRLLLDVSAGWHHQDVAQLPNDGSTIGSTSTSTLAGQPNVIWRGGTNLNTIQTFETLPADALAFCTDPANINLCRVTSYRTGGSGFLETTSLNSYQGKAIATFLVTALGHHVFKAGADVQLTNYDHTKAYSGGTILRETTSFGGSFYDYREYGYLSSPDTPTIQTTQHTLTNTSIVGGFVQDSWNLLDLITLNVGVRYDTQLVYNNAGALNLAFPNEWSPRLGLVYDFTQQGRSKLYASYAQYYESVPLDIADRSLSGEPEVRAYHTKAGGCTPAKTGPVSACSNTTGVAVLDPSSPNPHFGVYGGDTELIDPNIKAPSVSEFVVGGEYEVLPNARAGVSYTRRWLTSVVEDMSRDNATTFFVGNPGTGIAASFPTAQRDYNAVSVYLTKTFADLWMAQASYTYTSLYGNYDGLDRPESGQLDPNINSTFDLVKLLANQTGPLNGDINHNIKVYAAKEFVLTSALSLTLGLSYSGNSGPPQLYLGYNASPGYGPGEVYVLPRGAGPRLPWVNDIDGKLAVNVRLGKDSVLTASVDVFNIFNFQTPTGVDEEYSLDPTGVLPCVGCSVSDLPTIAGGTGSGKWLKEDLTAVLPTDLNPNYGHPTSYQPPRQLRFGLKLTF